MTCCAASSSLGAAGGKADLVGRVYRRKRTLKTGDLLLSVDGGEVASTTSQKVILGGIFDGGSVVAGCCELVGILA